MKNEYFLIFREDDNLKEGKPGNLIVVVEKNKEVNPFTYHKTKMDYMTHYIYLKRKFNMKVLDEENYKYFLSIFNNIPKGI